MRCSHYTRQSLNFRQGRPDSSDALPLLTLHESRQIRRQRRRRIHSTAFLREPFSEPANTRAKYARSLRVRRSVPINRRVQSYTRGSIDCVVTCRP